MKNHLTFNRTNTILYCEKWSETLDFYQHDLDLPITFTTDWFVEFQLAQGAHLSIADEKRASIQSCRGKGLTLSLQVENADQAWHQLSSKGLIVEPIKDHSWGARTFYLYDPEGHRLEIWSPVKENVQQT
jgi:predicted enzyme related to lactoylglutathione lyase